MMTKPVNPARQVLLDFGAGRLGETEAVAKLEQVLVPRHVYAPAANINEAARREQQDYTPLITDGSADEIDRAACDGTLTEAQALAMFVKVKPPAPIAEVWKP